MTERFVGNAPAYYERHLGPVLFEPYAIEVAARVPPSATRVLEIAAGTGRVTRRLLELLPRTGELVASDLNEPMLDVARSQIRDPRVVWKIADAQALPFETGLYDAVVCQFGLMFVPDQPLALREMRRVVAPGGTALISTWNAVERNPATYAAHQLARAELELAPAFYAQPFSLHDREAVCAMIRAAGFAEVRVDTVELMGTSESADHFATGAVRGNPLAKELADRGMDIAAYEARLADLLAARFGQAPMQAMLSAHVFTARA